MLVQYEVFVTSFRLGIYHILLHELECIRSFCFINVGFKL